MQKKRKKKYKLKKPLVTLIQILAVICVICAAVFIWYRQNINTIMNHGYTREASREIFRNGKKDWALSRPFAETLNAAFESNYWIEENLESYFRIEFQDHENLIPNINSLIEREYSNTQISIILSRGSDSEVAEFAKRDRERFVEEILSIEFSRLRYYDRYIAYMNETGFTERTAVLHVNLNMDIEEYVDPVIVDGNSDHPLVNRRFGLADDFSPNDLVIIADEFTNTEQRGRKKAVDALMKMFEEAEQEGLSFFVNSAYRSFEEQQEVYETFLGLYGQNFVNNFVARPGHSEHQTGLGFDLGSRNSNVFRDSREFLWMMENAHRFGFIQRYQARHQLITGFRDEPWHFRYVGVEIAEYIFERGISFEEYYILYLDIR